MTDVPDLHVSLSRAAGVSVVAVSRSGPVGVDVEVVARAGFDGFDGVVLAPGERATTPEQRARTWTRKEAVLKAAGLGLTVDPRLVDVSRDLVTWPVRAWLRDVRVPEGLICTVAVVSVEEPG